MEDNDIVELFLQRSENGLRELHRKYGRLCGSIAEKILKNRVDAEDCVNDVYLKVWDSIPPSKPSSLAAFVAKIAKNTALDIYSSYHADKRGGGQTPLSFDELDDMVSGDSSVESSAETRELLTAVNAFLDTLPKTKRTLFVNRYWYYYGLEELADMYGMKEHTVIVNLHRTRAALKEYLRKRGFDI